MCNVCGNREIYDWAQRNVTRSGCQASQVGSLRGRGWHPGDEPGRGSPWLHTLTVSLVGAQWPKAVPAPAAGRRLQVDAVRVLHAAMTLGAEVVPWGTVEITYQRVTSACCDPEYHNFLLISLILIPAIRNC